MKLRVALVWILYLASIFGVMFLSYFGDSTGYSGFVKHQLVSGLGYLMSLGQIDYLLAHSSYGPHYEFQRWVLPVYIKLGLFFIFIGGLINFIYVFYAKRNKDI